MLENAPNQQDANPGEYDPLRQALLRPIQHQLAKQGVYVSPEEALQLLEQKFVHDAKRYLLHELADHGIDATPDEALAIQRLHIIHRMMERTDATDPHEAIERMAIDNPPQQYETNE